MADTAAGLEKLLTRKDLAELGLGTENGIAVATHAGKFDDLPVIRIGRRCYYSAADVREFLERHRGAPRKRAPDTANGEPLAAAG